MEKNWKEGVNWEKPPNYLKVQRVNEIRIYFFGHLSSYFFGPKVVTRRPGLAPDLPRTFPPICSNYLTRLWPDFSPACSNYLTNIFPMTGPDLFQLFSLQILNQFGRNFSTTLPPDRDRFISWGFRKLSETISPLFFMYVWYNNCAKYVGKNAKKPRT